MNETKTPRIRKSIIVLLVFVLIFSAIFFIYAFSSGDNSKHIHIAKIKPTELTSTQAHQNVPLAPQQVPVPVVSIVNVSHGPAEDQAELNQFKAFIQNKITTDPSLTDNKKALYISYLNNLNTSVPVADKQQTEQLQHIAELNQQLHTLALKSQILDQTKHITEDSLNTKKNTYEAMKVDRLIQAVGNTRKVGIEDTIQLQMIFGFDSPKAILAYRNDKTGQFEKHTVSEGDMLGDNQYKVVKIASDKMMILSLSDGKIYTFHLQEI